MGSLSTSITYLTATDYSIWQKTERDHHVFFSLYSLHDSPSVIKLLLLLWLLLLLLLLWRHWVIRKVLSESGGVGLRKSRHLGLLEACHLRLLELHHAHYFFFFLRERKEKKLVWLRHCKTQYKYLAEAMAAAVVGEKIRSVCGASRP